MKRLIILLAVILLWTASVAAQNIVVYTANMQHGEGTDLATNYTRQVAAVADGDIVAVQERSTGDTGWNAPMASAGLAEAVYRENGHGNDGPAIWYRTSKFTVLDTETVALSTGFIGWDGSTSVDKAAVAAKFSMSGKVFWVVSTHLCWSACADSSGSHFSAQRVSQINALLSWISSTLNDAPVLLIGDMNFGPDYPKAPSGLQKDLFTASFNDLWNVGLAAGTATTPWGDRDANGVADMTPADLGTQTTGTRTHDTRRIDYLFLSKAQTLISLVSISVPDGRAACSVALTTGGVFKQCPDVASSQQSDVTDDQGVRVSDHNFIRAVLNVGVSAPTASLSCPATAFVGEPVICDGSASTNVNGQVGWSTQTLTTDGTAPVDLNFGDGLGAYSRSDLLRSTHVYLAPATYTVSLTVKNSAGVTASTSAQVVISDIPAATGGAIQTLSDQGSEAANRTALQTALNTAFAANTVEQEICLPVITYVGPFTVPTAAGTKYVTIKPCTMTGMPGPLQRVTPAHSALMPKIQSQVESPSQTGVPLIVPGGRSYLRVLGIEFNRTVTRQQHNIVEIGSDATTYAALPHHIIFDRCYMHGTPFDNTTRGLYVKADNFSLINSYLTDLHDSGSDSQALAAFAGTGHGIVNNHLEGYGENVLYGGSDSGIKFQATCASATSPTGCTLNSAANLRVGDGISLTVGGVRGPWTASIVRSIAGNVITFDTITNSSGVATAPDTTTNAVKFGGSPADIFVARNYLFKSLFYKCTDAPNPSDPCIPDPAYNGSYKPAVKNSFELKHAMRVLVVANYIHNHWGGQGQAGPTILLTPRNQTCYTSCTSQDNPWTMVRDVHLLSNRVKKIPDLVNILGTDNLNLTGTEESGPSAFVQYVRLSNNLIDEVDPNGLSGDKGNILFAFPGARHVYVIHNTQVNVSGGSIIASTENYVGRVTADALVLNNIFKHLTYGLFGDGLLADNFIAAFFPDGFVHHNVISDDLSMIGPNGETWTAPRGGPNYFPPTINTGTFINMAGGNYRLRSDSPYKAGNATPATDGLDIGVNQDTVDTATANAIAGNWAVSGTSSGAVSGRGTLKGRTVIK